jgi:hypothetical protein
LCFAAALAAVASTASAQNWSGDARRIGMGGVGSSENLATKMIESDEDGYRTIVIPLGLFQILKNTDIFNPDSDEFDLVRSVEYASSPLHYTFDRDGTGSGVELVNDLRNGQLSNDLNRYRGFVPVSQPVAYGLASPSFGVTIPVYRRDKTRHGAYVGAGPYFPFRGALSVDDQLVSILSSGTDVYIANTSMPVTSEVRAEAALAITGGYRGRYELPIGEGDRDGLYVALNYNWLRGFRYEDEDIMLRLDTDSAGLVTLNTSLPSPIVVGRLNSSDGRGFAIDLGAAVVVNRWEFGFGVNGVANRIEWTEVEGTTYTLDNILTGDGDFAEIGPFPVADTTIKQPVEYLGNVGYRADRWRAIAEYGTRVSDDPADEGRFSSESFRGGFEYRFMLLEPRGGVYYSRDRWQPSAGLGLNFGKIGIDSAIYWTDANVQRKRRAAYALSLRIGSRND